MLDRLIEKRRHPIQPVHFTSPYRWRQVCSSNVVVVVVVVVAVVIIVVVVVVNHANTSGQFL